MKRNHQIALGVLVIVVLTGIVTTSMGSTTPKLAPAELESGSYQGEYVQLEGRATDVTRGSKVRMTVVGNTSDARVPVVVTTDDVPATLRSGELVIVKGVYRDGKLRASEVLVRSHSGQGSKS
ncbi:MAG: cytochrome c-type biogenesis protein CcmE [Halobacteriales archaeon]|jgi:cytochrome c-type biogenesis protein CcmE